MSHTEVLLPVLGVLDLYFHTSLMIQNVVAWHIIASEISLGNKTCFAFYIIMQSSTIPLSWVMLRSPTPSHLTVGYRSPPTRCNKIKIILRVYITSKLLQERVWYLRSHVLVVLRQASVDVCKQQEDNKCGSAQPVFFPSRKFYSPLMPVFAVHTYSKLQAAECRR